MEAKVRKPRGRRVLPDMSSHPKVVERLQEFPKSAKKGYLRAMSGMSRNAAIKAFCQACAGFVRAAVRECPSEGCPLYPYRPYQDRGEA